MLVPIIFALLGNFCSAADQATSITSTTIPIHTALINNASKPVNPTYPGFAFEERSFYLYVGNESHPNTFSVNLIKEIVNRTGSAPVIRVGGTSLDHSTYNPNQKAVWTSPSEGNPNVPANMTFGPSYFSSFAVLPFAQYIVDIPFATKDEKPSFTLKNSTAFAKAAYKAIGTDKIVALEIGNEPNLYVPQGYRVSGYGPDAYANEWGNWTGLIDDALDIPKDKKYWQAATIASANNLGKWDIKDVYNAGLNRYASRIKSVSMHYYQILANADSTIKDLMNHNAIAIRMKSQFGAAVDFLGSTPLNLAEVGSTLGSKLTDAQKTALEASMGAALWQVDAMLYGMSIGVNRINYQSGIGFGFDMWQPIEWKGKAAYVAPPYYAHVFSADFIGNPGDSWQNDSIRVANIDLGSEVLSAYAAYDPNSKDLRKVAIVNLDIWDDGMSAGRPVVDASMNVPTGVKSARVKRFSSPKGATATEEDQLAFAGQRWTFKNGGVPESVGNGPETVQVSGGKVVVSVKASEAVILEMLR